MLNWLVPTYGNWGGPGYSGGRRPKHINRRRRRGLREPTDPFDNAFMEHDFGYEDEQYLASDKKMLEVLDKLDPTIGSYPWLAKHVFRAISRARELGMLDPGVESNPGPRQKLRDRMRDKETEYVPRHVLEAPVLPAVYPRSLAQQTYRAAWTSTAPTWYTLCSAAAGWTLTSLTPAVNDRLAFTFTDASGSPSAPSGGWVFPSLRGATCFQIHLSAEIYTLTALAFGIQVNFSCVVDTDGTLTEQRRSFVIAQSTTFPDMTFNFKLTPTSKVTLWMQSTTSLGWTTFYCWPGFMAVGAAASGSVGTLWLLEGKQESSGFEDEEGNPWPREGSEEELSFVKLRFPETFKLGGLELVRAKKRMKLQIVTEIEPVKPAGGF